MTFVRSAGVLLHPTSLPGAHGIGEFGAEAHRFLDFMVDAGLTIWQMLPLGPTGYGDSPYQCFSAFAGNPLLVALPEARSDARSGALAESFPTHTVDFARVIAHKRARLSEVCATFVADRNYRAFVETQLGWLHDYALFRALKDAHGGAAWTDWPNELAQREPTAMRRWRSALSAQMTRVMVEQYLFFSQYDQLRRAARERGIALMGDLPIYVAHDSADVWAKPHLFKLDATGRPLVQAGVPPDYFSQTGQLWGNPIYDWGAMRADGYAWWIERMRAALDMFDMVRLDHFRGFDAYWEVPADASTAELGRWVSGPGAAVFQAMTQALGPLPIVAENLGVITESVEALRKDLGFPGMAVLQFAFSNNGAPSDFMPHNLERAVVAYTGTHDNDTTLGWWLGGSGDSTRSVIDVQRERAYAQRYLNTDGSDMHWVMIRAALASVANTVLIPMQDILGLGSEARMNLPGRPSGNWSFRYSSDQLTPTMTARLRALVDTYQRAPDRRDASPTIVRLTA